MASHRVNYALGATLIGSGLTYAEAAPQCGAANGESLRRGLARKGVTLRRVRAMSVPDERVQSVASRVATRAAEILSQRTRDKLSETVADGLERVAMVKMSGVGTERALKHAQTLKTLAETGKIAFADWNETANPSLVQVNILNQLTPESVQESSPVIEVSSTPA